MLHKIAISNFLSFANEETFDLSVPRRTPAGPAVAETAAGRFAKCAILFGNNGSGKTNVLKAITFLNFLLRQSARAEAEQELPFLPFFPREYGSSNLSELFAVFSSDSVVYDYAVKFNRIKIVEEIFRRQIGRKSELLYRRKENEIEISKTLGLTDLAMQKFNIQSNAALMSILLVIGEPQIRSLLAGPLNIFSDVHGRRPYGPWRSEAATRFYSRNVKSQEMLRLLLSEFDVGVTDVEFLDAEELEESDALALAIGKGRTPPAGHIDKEEHKIPIFVHGDSGRLPLHSESEGTQSLYNYLFRIFDVLQTGGIAVLDEFDGSVHPSNIGKVINLFRSPNTNPRNAQLVMAVHTASLLQELEKEEVFFCHKNGRGRTHIYGLKNLEDVRRIDNYYAKYLAGFYGAIPHSHLPRDGQTHRKD